MKVKVKNVCSLSCLQRILSIIQLVIDQTIHLHYFIFVVDLKQPKISLLNSNETTATFIHYPSYEYTKAAFVGYNVTLIGTSKSKFFARTIYRQFIHKEGDLFTLRNLPTYFNFTADIQILFAQGTGKAVSVPIATPDSSQLL